MKPTSKTDPEAMLCEIVGVLGMGRLGTAFANGLRAIGCEVHARYRDAAQQDLGSWLKPLDLICLSVRDDQIAGLVQTLARFNLMGKMVLIHAGTIPLETLNPLLQQGSRIGKFHPLMSFSDKKSGGIPEGTPFAIEGEGVEAVVRPWVEAWHGQLFHVRGAQWRTYHLAAVVAANFLPLFIRKGGELLEELTGGDQSEALAWLAPLIRHSVEKALNPNEDLPFSGPAIRGDGQVLAAQEAILAGTSQSWADLYRLASQQIAKLGDEANNGLKKT